MDAFDPERTEHEEHIDLWHDKLIQAHYLALPGGVARSCFIMRPPNLEEALRELATFGETVLGTHDEVTGDGSSYPGYVCSLWLRGREEGADPIIADSLNPTLAALRCLREVLAEIASESAEGFADIEAFLREQ